MTKNKQGLSNVKHYTIQDKTSYMIHANNFYCFLIIFDLFCNVSIIQGPMHDRFRVLQSENKFLLFNKIIGCYCSNKGHKRNFLLSFMINLMG